MPSQLPWSHFHVDAAGRITGFTLDRCETCGGEIQAPNSVNLHEPPARLLALGLTQAAKLPPEGFYNEETDREACDRCPRLGGIPEAPGHVLGFPLKK